MKTNRNTLSRRQMIKTSLAAGTVFVLGFQLTGCDDDASSVITKLTREDNFVPNAWIMIDPNDIVTVMVNHSEMGQGILTALPMIVADEMDADWSKVRSEHAPVADVYKNPKMRIQATGGSTSVTTCWDILRKAGATTRLLFINSAAKTWKVSPDECRTKNSKVLHSKTGRQLRYGELLETAESLKIPEDAPLKSSSKFALIGKGLPRLDTIQKTDGSAIFGMDVKLPGLLIATVVHPPIIGSKPMAVVSDEALKMPGVKHVLMISTGVAVVADSFWQANKAVEKLKISWSEGNTVTADTQVLKQRWQKLSEQEGDTTYELGDIDKIDPQKGHRVDASYELPFQAHATQEPMNCTADVREDKCDIWVPTQNQGGSHGIAVNITGLDPESVNVHTTFLGGGFGRRGEIDFVIEAVELSQALKKPVKVIWTREEDMRTDVYRPASLNRMSAIIDPDGQPLSWRHRMVGMDHIVQLIPKFAPIMVPHWFPDFLKRSSASLSGSLAGTFAAGKGLTGGAGPLPYNIKNVKVEFVEDDIGVPVGFWRSVANSSNGFVVESFIDELAVFAKKDPYEYRYHLLEGNHRLQNTLKLAAEKSGWTKPAANNASRGIASHNFHDTLITLIAEVTVSKKGDIKIHRIVCAVDCGVVINPRIIKAQMESCIAYGITATIKSSITLTKGKVDQGNFDSFPILRMDEMPEVETYIVESDSPPTGIGEVAVPPIAPAITNAIFAATGRRIRRLPIRSEDLKASS
jgi:isoquinoline 1-oxidoreductase subunit beta